MSKDPTFEYADALLKLETAAKTLLDGAGHIGPPLNTYVVSPKDVQQLREALTKARKVLES